MKVNKRLKNKCGLHIREVNIRIHLVNEGRVVSDRNENVFMFIVKYILYISQYIV